MLLIDPGSEPCFKMEYMKLHTEEEEREEVGKREGWRERDMHVHVCTEDFIYYFVCVCLCKG